jgi:hypothetical protein
MIDFNKFPVMDAEFEKLRKQWYQTENIAFNIINAIKYRETCFIGDHRPVRYIKANAIVYLSKNFERYRFFEEPFNLYQSLARYPRMPLFSFDSKEKKPQTVAFHDNRVSYMDSFDFLLDIDNKNIEMAYNSALKMKRILDKCKVPYTLMFSGKKGFHIKIEYDDFPIELKKLSFPLSDRLKKTAENIFEKEQLDDLDLGVFDLQRIAKTPYSVVYPNYLVALPLSDEELDNFSIKEVSLPYLITKTDKMYLRGFRKRKGTIEGTQEFFDNYKNI